ncbi:MAG TPA: hypothetical protein VFQ85_10010 [Mycobacteriales bacterium]|jgi:hypothetical protein|nr:hypothetical protein [Mycobacteriales bacterium]
MNVRLLTVALAATAVAATGAVAVSVRTRDVRLVEARPAAVPTPLGTDNVVPKYLPPGAVEDTGTNGRPDYPEGTMWFLPGAANANTIPPGGGGDLLTTHPETELDVSFARGILTLPDLLPGDDWYSVTPTTVAGLPAVLTAPHAGPWGIVRVDWVDSMGYHTVMCDRKKTPEGISGISPEELLKVAASLYD